MTSVEMEEANEAVHGVVEVKPSNAWRPDAAGIFFSLLLAMWGVVVAVLLKNGNTRLWQVFAAFVFFEGVNRTLDLYLRRRSEIVGGLTPAVYADFLNTSVSLVHSSIISLLGKVSVSTLIPFFSRSYFISFCLFLSVFIMFWIGHRIVIVLA